ncbi:MAG TPA: hypothetical protein PKE47_02050 [Verrucomicrobiota bacterium]|mgnify:CR=1 FL=1|nr:hypothetical protein [Verrucomicrobiota bacterium]
MAHGLTAGELDALRLAFAAEPDIASVDLARKQVMHFPDSPCYVIAVRVKAPWWQPRSSTANEKLLNRLLEKLPLPGHSFAFLPEQQFKALGRKVAAVTGARVYERAR